VRGRYDGSRRNPYNEIECGDHYARAMSGWTMLEAFTSTRYDAITRTLELGRTVERYPFVTGIAWGVITNEPERVQVQCHGGRLELAAVTVDGDPVRLELPRSLAAGETLLLDVG
jgi:hypothetical protein